MQSSIDDIPRFPETVLIGKRHRDAVNRITAECRPVISELTFAYLWCWAPYIKTSLTRFDDWLLVIINNRRRAETLALPPLGDLQGFSGAVMVRVLEKGIADAFARIPGCLHDRANLPECLESEKERERADYVYLTRDLIDLPGQRFHSKKNHIRHFYRAFPDARYQAIDEETAGLCIDFTRRWLSRHPSGGLKGLRQEAEVSMQMLENFSWLGLSGGMFLNGDGYPVAYALGEELAPDTFVVRVEKADTDIPGSYQAINREFISNAASGYRWTNREQDLGLTGLRRAKKSYHPHHMIEKYRITRRKDKRSGPL